MTKKHKLLYIFHFETVSDVLKAPLEAKND